MDISTKYMKFGYQSYLGHDVCTLISFPIRISPKISILLDDIESQLNTRDPRLVEWFKMEQLPVFAEHFTPLLGRWSTEYPTRFAHGT